MKCSGCKLYHFILISSLSASPKRQCYYACINILFLCVEALCDLCGRTLLKLKSQRKRHRTTESSQRAKRKEKPINYPNFGSNLAENATRSHFKSQSSNIFSLPICKVLVASCTSFRKVSKAKINKNSAMTNSVTIN